MKKINYSFHDPDQPASKPGTMSATPSLSQPATPVGVTPLEMEVKKPAYPTPISPGETMPVTSDNNNAKQENWPWLRNLFGALTTLPNWLLWGIALVLLLFDLFNLYHVIKDNPDWQTVTDYGVYYQAAQAVAQNHNPYDRHLYVIQTYYGEWQISDRYAYPPLLAELLAVPIGILGGEATRYGWIGLNLVALAISLSLLLRSFGIVSLRWSWVALGIGLYGFSYLGRNELFHGQVNPLLLLLLTGGLWFQQRNRSTLAGICWGLIFVVKPFFGLLVLFLLWKRQWQSAWVSLVTAAGLAGLSFLPLFLNPAAGGLTTLQNWLEAANSFSAGGLASRPDNLALHGLLLRSFVANPFTTPLLNSGLAFVVGDLLVAGVLMVIFALSVITTNNINKYPDRDGVKSNWFGENSTTSLAWNLMDLGLFCSLIFTFGPLTEQDYFLFLLPGLLGVIIVGLHSLGFSKTGEVEVVEEEKSTNPGKKYLPKQGQVQRWWLLTLTLWLFFFVIQCNPIHFEPLKLPLDPSGLPGTQPGGLRVLATGLTGLALFVISGSLAWTRRLTNKAGTISK